MKRQPTIRNRAKHQHWVPQFYLRYYATPESRTSKQPKVWIFSKDEGDGDEKLTSVRNVCGQRYLYSPMLETGGRDWALDDLLNELESGLGSIWPALVERYIALDDPHVRRAVALFVAVTHLRNPDVRAQVEQMHSTLVKIYEDGPMLADGTPDIAGIEINGKYHPVSTNGWHQYRTWGKDDHDRFFVDIVRSEAIRTAQHLMEKRWSVVLAEEDTFITTDKPVGLQHEAREKFGIQTEGTIVTFPLSPRRLLVLDDLHAEPANQYYPLAEGAGAAFNFTIWRSARRFLITGRSVPVVLEEMLSLDPDSNVS